MFVILRAAAFLLLLFFSACATHPLQPQKSANVLSKEAVHKCEANVPRPAPKAEISIRWTVEANGNVTNLNSSVQSGEAKYFDAFQACLKAAVKKLKYEATNGSREFSEIFHFQ